MKKRLLKIGVIFGVIGLLVSCDFDGLELIDTESTVQSIDVAKNVIEENADAELQVVKVFENVNNYGIIEEGKKSVNVEGEPSYILEGNKLTIDFSNVSDVNGKIIVAFNQSPIPFYKKGLIGEVAFENYVNTGVSISGKFSLSMDEVDNTSVKFSLNSVDYMTFTDAVNNSYEWMCEQSVLWSEGYLTPSNRDDDVFLINGYSIQSRNSESNRMEVDNVTQRSDCDFLVDGTISVLALYGTDNEFLITTEFGVDANKVDNGACDAWILMNSEGIVDDLHIEISSL